MSCIACHTLHVTRYTSNVTPHTPPDFILLLDSLLLQLLTRFVSEWGGRATEATATAQLRFAGGSGDNSSVDETWNSFSAELQASPAVASMSVEFIAVVVVVLVVLAVVVLLVLQLFGCYILSIAMAT
jgi:hypothetical protein